MIKGKRSLALTALLLFAPVMAQAANTVLAGVFDGSQPKGQPLPGTCGGNTPLAYIDAGIMQVSVTGTYSVFDALYLSGIKNNGVDISALLYEGPFDINDPDAFLVTPDGVDNVEQVTLEAGRQYTLVVQQWCTNREGAWAVTFTGPGNVTSAYAVDTPDLTEGIFTNADPVANTQCGNSQYEQTGPVRVSATGTYYYQDVSLWAGGIDLCLQVYSAPFDPGNPNANRVATSNPSGDYLDDAGTIGLQAGQDYWFVVQPLDVQDTGDYFFVLAPPAPFRISKALAGAWFNPGTDGQGFFIDVYDNVNQAFVGWYTYDLARPVDGTATLGEPGHRWLTALGPIDGAEAALDVYLARGGVFDAPEPPIEPQTIVGSMTLEFADCINGSVNYNLTTPAVSGQMPIVPLAYDHVELCESLTRGPGVPGPL